MKGPTPAAAVIERLGLHLLVDCPPLDQPVFVDRDLWAKIVLNLLSNAVKFTPADGTVTLRTSNENGALRLEVSDTGVGIDPEMMPRLFRAFEQGERAVSRQFGGLGLGLSIVKSLVTMHKASISAMSGGSGGGSADTCMRTSATGSSDAKGGFPASIS